MKKKDTTEAVAEALPHPYASLDLAEMRTIISDRDANSQARIAHKATQVRDLALSDEEGRIALWLVVHEGGV